MPRLFLALHPPSDVARELLELLAALELPPHRPTPLDQLHMTVLFLGDVPERDVAKTIESAERAAASVAPFELRLRALEALPEQGLARLLAAATDTPRELSELRRRLVARLAAQRAKTGPLHPHLTLCRFRSPTRLSFEPRPLEGPAFGVTALSLHKSVLHATGAEHRQLARIPLVGA